MKNIYEATFWDYYDFEMTEFTKEFDNFTKCKEYTINILNNNAIPNYHIYRNNREIYLSNGKEIKGEK